MNIASRLLFIVTVCLFAVCVFAQNAAAPPTPYPSPMTGYVGRYLDSTSTSSWQFIGPTLPRTYRAAVAKAAPDRDMLYMIIGSTFVGQTLSTFADRVSAGPLAEINRADPQGERYLPFEKWVDPERTPGWDPPPLIDSQDRLFDFDFDDRGYIYLAYSFIGFGIIDEDFQKVAQLISPFIDIVPQRVVGFRNGSSYYALVSDLTSATRLYDVTDPSAPTSTFVSFVNDGFRSAARSTDGRIAFVMDNQQLHIHTPATILSSAAPIYISPATGPFRDVTTDGTNFYALGRNGRDIHVLQPSGATYTDTVITSVNDLPNQLIAYGAGYLTVSNDSRRGAIYRVDGGTLTLLHDGEYYYDWLVGTPVLFAFPRMLLPVFDGEQTLLVGALHGLGELFTMTPQPPLTVAPQFAPATIDASGTSIFTLTITNPNPVPVPFSLGDSLPANVVSTGANLQTTCGFGVLSAPAQASSFQLTNASVGASSSCTVTVEVTSTVPGTHTITIPAGAITSADNSNGASAEAALLVAPLDAPQLAKAFSAPTAAPNVPVRMTITLTNPNALAMTGVAFSDIYPATLVNATTVNPLNTCGGTLTAASGGTFLSLSGATIPASQSCTVAVDVLITQPGSVTNTIPVGAVTSDNADPNSTAAPATINAAAIAAVPALSEWALIVMTAFLGVVAMSRLRM